MNKKKLYWGFNSLCLFVIGMIVLSLTGCGGGGGGGVTASPTTTNVTLATKAARVGDTLVDAITVSANQSQTIQIRTIINNSTGSPVSNPIASISVTDPGINFVTGSGTTTYKNNGADKTENIADTVASTAGLALPFILDTGYSARIDFRISVASDADNGSKSVIVRVNGVSTTITVNVGGSTTGTGTITVTSNLAASFVLDGTTYNISSDGGSQAFNSQAGTHSFSCGALNGYTVVASAASGTLTANGSLSFSCTYTATSGNASCQWNGNTYAHGTTVQQGTCNSCNCNNGNWQCTGACPSVGTITVTSNKATSFTLTGAANYSGNVTSDGGTYTVSNATPGSYSITCNAITGYTVTASPVTSGTLASGGSLAFSCTYTAIPVTTTGTVNVRSNINVANTIITCNGSSYSHYMDPVGGQYGYSATMPTGSCTLSCQTPIGSQVLNTSTSTLSGTLTANGSLTLTCTYGEDGIVGPSM